MSSKMIQLRNVPADLHRRLKARAALAGMSLSDYLLAEVRRVAEQPTIEELWERIKRRGAVELTVNPADLIREEREAR
jgi:plasmid stability protein